MIRIVTILFFLAASALAQSTYVGSEACKTCHSATHTSWTNTLHSKIHELPSSTTIKGDFTSTSPISMGSTYTKAKATVKTVGGKYYVNIDTVNGTSGKDYEVAYTYGGGWKQRYLTKIENSYYILPVQWNSKGYKDNSSGTWLNYTPATWYNSDGTIKSFNNAFRTKSWDKNCMGCHVSGYKIDKSITGTDTAWVGIWGPGNAAGDIVVGCESCHGPGSQHASTGDKTKIVNPVKLSSKLRRLEVCGQCHNRASSWKGTGIVGSHEYSKDEINNKYFIPGDSLALYMNFATAPNTTGGPGTWQDTRFARQHHQQYQEWQLSKHFTNQFVSIDCMTCHTAHTDNEHQLVGTITSGMDVFTVTKGDNTLCLSCHATFGPFVSITKAWVKNQATYRDSIAKYVSAHTNHKVYNPETGMNNCISCHMTRTASTSSTKYDISTHTFLVVSPKKTLDYKTSTSPVKGMLNTCSSCHRDGVDKAATGPTFGVGKDATLLDWTEATDVQLADSLWKHYQTMFPTSVKQISSATPENFALLQNYPNPFNPSTEIQFNVSARMKVRLVVYNIVGQEVKTLVNGMMDAGTYKSVWNGKNDYGEYAASGVYLYRLESENFTQTKKMILAK